MDRNKKGTQGTKRGKSQKGRSPVGAKSTMGSKRDMSAKPKR